MELTGEQRKAIDCKGRVIVSASAGSGKTFVMIKRLVSAILNGADCENVLAVTFTKKAAGQMRDKLRIALIDAIKNSDSAEEKKKLKVQLTKLASANISTIHAFCAKLLRTYFYALGIDGTFDIISADDGEAKKLKNSAVDSLFERYYAEDNKHFKLLLKCYRKKRNDASLKYTLLDAYTKLRENARYKDILNSVQSVFTEEGFDKICGEINQLCSEKYLALKCAAEQFAKDFYHPNEQYKKILEDIIKNLENAEKSDIFAPQPPLTAMTKPRDKTEGEKEAGEVFKTFKAKLTLRYKNVKEDVKDREYELDKFLKSGEIAVALSYVLMQLDAEYSALKADENKLDYNDLEHLTLKLLDDEVLRKEISSKFDLVFVDEYQDVNSVQEEIISKIGGDNVFLVGDIKQAIYGFRGSKPVYFKDKFEKYLVSGNALRLSHNFRSSDGVLKFVNSVFSTVMTEQSSGIDYSGQGVMLCGGGYPEGYGDVCIHVFGSEECEKSEPEVYSVKSGLAGVKHSREALAVLEIVKRELRSQHYDLKSGEMVDTQPSDICILTRKHNSNADEIARTLSDAGYSVIGAEDSNIFNRAEVRQMFDILSYLDNTEQDIPLATALLSPLGDFTCDDLARIKTGARLPDRPAFRDCCKKYATLHNDVITEKLKRFDKKVKRLRELAKVLSGAEIVDKILEGTGLEAVYSAGNGSKLRNVRRLAEEGEGVTVSAMLQKLKDGGYKIKLLSPVSEDSIKLMTMHSSKGLEFPIVIISDICATYKGMEGDSIAFDEKTGFAPKYYDFNEMTVYTPVSARLAKLKESREELRNEYNLFYVACTRAMCNLHIMAEEVKFYDPSQLCFANCYADMFDLSKYNLDFMENITDDTAKDGINIVSSADNGIKEIIESKFMREYVRADSVNLPVKSSASAILRLYSDENFKVCELFEGEGETGTERGEAYHRFLELCNFAVKDREGISGEIERFVSEGRLSPSQRELIDADELSAILAMPVFCGLEGRKTFREQEFLCRLPANVLFKTEADDAVLVQGAIDLLVKTDGGYQIVDYKYSHKDDDGLIHSYKRQLELYRNAVSQITGTEKDRISATIVNILKKRQINL